MPPRILLRFWTARNPENRVSDAMRLNGRKCEDDIVQADIKLLPFKAISGPGDNLMTQVNASGEEK